MALSDLFAVLENPNAVVTVNEANGTQIVKFYLSGSTQLLATLLAREVSTFVAKSANDYVITLVEE